MLIGLIADTHIPEAAKELPNQVYEVFKDVDLILHAGDMHIIRVLDWLESLAPVKAARGNGDLSDGPTPLVPDDPRVQKTHVMEIEGLKIGMVHDFPLPHEAPWLSLGGFMGHLFGGRMDIVVCGHTHIAHITPHEGTLIVNPGSPTMANNLRDSLGTVGLLAIESDTPQVEIVQLK